MDGIGSADNIATEGRRAEVPGDDLQRTAGFAPIVALSVAIAIGTLLVAAPVAREILPVNELPEPFADRHQNAETLIYLFCFAVVLPLAVIVAARVADRIASGPNRHGLVALAGVLTGTLALVPLATRLTERLSGRGTEAVLLTGAVIWCIVAALTLWRAASPRPWRALRLLTRAFPYVAAVAGLLILAVVLSFTRWDSISPVTLATGVVAAGGVVLAQGRIGIPAPRRPLGIAVDAMVIVLLLLAVPNLVVFVTGDPTSAVQTSFIQFHQNFYLGPANQILAGDALLIDTLSQYGVGSIYFLAGIFQAIPIGNGTLGLTEGLLSALMFIGTYAAIRIAGVSRLLAGSAMAVAVTVLVFGLEYPLGGLLQHGAFRFGLPVGIIVGAVAESRWPRAAGPARMLQLLTVAIASIWALEGFLYSILTVAAVIAVRLAIMPRADRSRELLAWGAGIAAGCLTAHILLAGATLIATGQLPDWGWYLNTLREFLSGQVGDVTYDFSRWSSGLALGVVYLASGAALAVVLRRRRDIVAREPTMLIGIAAMTAFGIALYSYIVNRSADHIIPYVSLPAVALTALWLALLLRPWLSVSLLVRRVGLGSVLVVAALLVAVAASSVRTRAPESALGHVWPGGRSLPGALERLWDPPPLSPVAPQGEQLLDAHMPGERRSIVLTSPDPGLEILIRSGRASAVPLGAPYEDSYVPEDHLGPLGRFVETLSPGDRMLIDAPARGVFERYRDEPTRDPFENSLFGVPAVDAGLTTLQEWVLREVGLRFDLREVARSPNGLEVVELIPRQAPV